MRALGAKFIPPTANCVANTTTNIGTPTYREIFNIKNKASNDFVFGKSSSLSFPVKTNRFPHSNKSGLNAKEKAYISNKAPAIPVKTNISLELKTFPSSLCLSILRWEGSSVFSCPSWFSSAIF